jgi:hypothetical protein
MVLSEQQPLAWSVTHTPVPHSWIVLWFSVGDEWSFM